MRTNDLISITKEEAIWLLNKLKESTVASITFNETISCFKNVPHLSYKLFSYGLCFAELLSHYDLFPGRCQRLVTAILLYVLFKNGDHLSGSIFSENLVQIIDEERSVSSLAGIKKFDSHDVAFIVEVLTSNTRILDLTPNNAINNFLPADHKPHIKRIIEELTDTSYIHASFQDRLRFPIVMTLNPNQNDSSIENNDVLQFTANLLVAAVKNAKECFVPSMIRPAPPPMEGDLIEIPWHFSQARHLFPPFHGRSRPLKCEPHEIEKKPCKNYFMHCQFSFLKKLLSRRDISSEELGCLVDLIIATEEFNLFERIKSVGREIFVQILMANAHAAKIIVLSSHPSPLFNDLLNILADISTFRTLEVVKELCNEKCERGSLLPNDFVCKYIENFIQKMTNVEDTGDSTGGKGRWIRLLCAFILSIYKQKLFDLRAIMQTIQAFSCEHTRIKDAQALYKAIRSAED